MRVRRRTPLLAALLFVSLASVRAQSVVDPSGHWAGSIQTPAGTEMPFELDVAKDGQGSLAATYTSPTEGVKGLPFLNVTVAGRSVSLQIRENGTLKGDLSADGKTLSGLFTAIDPTGVEIALPFTLNRVGAAVIEPQPKSAPIPAALAGTWDGTIEVNGFHVELRLTLSNQRDGTAIGSLTNVTRGEADLPLSEIAQKASTVTFRVKAVGGSYSGTLNPAGTELAGNLTQDTGVRPLTFRRAAAAAGRK